MKSDLPNFWRFFEQVTGKTRATKEKRDPGHEKERARRGWNGKDKPEEAEF